MAAPDVEKGVVATASASRSPHKHSHGRHFISHEGRHIHIATSPQEAVDLRKRLETVEHPFDLYLHGSPEHLEALQKHHTHHEQSRETLREKHGDVYEQFHTIHSELDWIAADLKNITAQGVRLDASFSKYGYSAHLRKS